MNRYYLLPILFLSFCFSSFGQVFKVYELDRYSRDSTIAPIKNGQFADINATLYLTFDKEAIAEAIREFSGSDTIAVDQLKQLRAVLANQVEIMEGFKSYAQDPNLNSLNDLADRMNVFFMEAERYPEIQDLYNQYSAAYNQKYSRSERRQAGIGEVPLRDEFIFGEMARKATDLAQQIQSGLTGGDVRFLLSGRLATENGEREVKLSDDFDTFAADVFTVSRWQSTMTMESQQQLQEIGVLSTRLNALMDVKGEDIRNWLKNSFGAEDCLKDVEDRLLSIPQVVSTIAPAMANEVKQLAAQPYKQARKLVEEYSSQLADAPGISTVSLLERFSGQLLNTADSIEALVSTVDNKLIARLREIPSDPQVSAFITTFDSCKVRLQADKNQILTIAGRLSALFGHTKKAAQASTSLSEQVRRLSFDAIPNESYVDLRNTGARSNGDQMKIRAILEEVTTGTPARKIIEQRIFTLQQIGMYSTLKPMMLLAAPNGSGNNVDLEGKNFQFAPSYSILFKFGSRKSKAFNDIWQPGLGVNFGALDFNTDAVPEFGAAFELTLLRDYFSGGYGYNFGADEAYYFIGLRLPIGAIPLPIFNEVQTK